MQTFPQGPQGHKGPKNGKQLIFKIFKIEIVIDSIWSYMILLDCDRLWREIRKGHGTWHSAPGWQQQQTKPSHTGAMTVFQVFSAQQPSQFITIHHNSSQLITIHHNHNSSQFCFCSACLAWVIWAWSPVRWALTSQTRHINCSRIRWDSNQHRWQTSAVTFGVLVELILRRHLSATDEPGIAILQALPILWNKRGCQHVSTTLHFFNWSELTNRNALCDSILQSAGTKAQSESRPCPDDSPPGCRLVLSNHV